MLLALVVCIISIQQQLNLSWSDILTTMKQEKLLNLWSTNPSKGDYFLKHILGGAFITIAMTGLDQEMMQKNISVKTLRGAQKNMVVFSVILLFVNALFLLLGGVLTLFAKQHGLDLKPDDLFPSIVQNYLPLGVFIIFIIGLISALFPSVDGAITALTSSFCIDILGFERKNLEEKERQRIRKWVHFGFAGLFMLIVFVLKWYNNKSIVDLIFEIAGYTYGPLLGLFAFGILTKRNLNHKSVPFICLSAPTMCYFLNLYSKDIFNNYVIGNEMLILNGLLTFILLLTFSKNSKNVTTH
jgi:Na+/proline symporter